jgi:site-specific DNA-methyltransferase (adenine-specific)
MKVTEKIYIENCDNMQLMARYPDNYFDLAIVDPPYGIDATKFEMGGRKRNKEDKKKNWDSSIPSNEYFNELFRISKNQVIWGGNYFPLPNSQYFAIWDKGETMYGRDFAECEYAWVRKGGTRIYKKNPNQLERIHPTQKPVALYKWILDKYAKEGDKILDTHLGSMSIAIACADYGFELVGCELDPDYYNAGIKRLQNHLSQTKINFDI